ncbi:MAG TPA: Glu/Leu/Phe/Val dehydrogenase [Planctomycetes bacterium]|nr:Glu/Leu/Phe/Val dehydrogenase [Planctomycetota bacterium]
MAVHVLDAMAREGFEELVALHDRRSGLRGFLGIHDTSRGPAFGGIRRFPYRNEKSALIDCLRLSRAMSRKCALADLPGGGAKLVVLDHPGLDLAEAYRHIGRVVERQAGRYFAGPDVGTGWRELSYVAEETDRVTRPGDEGPGDLAGATAAGVFAAIAAALRHLHGSESWEERTFVVQGLGSVGWRLAARLRGLGARVLAADLEEEPCERAHEELGVEILASGTELDTACDVFCPCAMGGLLHDLSIQRLQARIVCGAANNPLARTHHAMQLFERGILYVPDFVVSAGAVIRGAEFHLTGRPTPLEEIEARIGATVRDVLERAAAKERSPYVIAQHEADLRILRSRARADAT